MSKVKCDESQLQCSPSVCKTKCPYRPEMQHLQRLSLKILSDRCLPLDLGFSPVSDRVSAIYSSKPHNALDLLKRDKPLMTLNGKAYIANEVCSLLLQRASHSLLFLLQSFGLLWILPWDHSRALSQNEQVHPLSEQEQAQLIRTADSRHADDAKFSFLNQWKSSNTDTTDPGISNSSIHSCATEHTLASCYKSTWLPDLSQPLLYFRYF